MPPRPAKYTKISFEMKQMLINYCCDRISYVGTMPLRIAITFLYGSW